MILLTIILTILAILILAIVLCVVNAPLRLSMRISQSIQYDVEFGYSMENVWEGMYWFSIIKLEYNNENNIEYASLLINWFRSSKYPKNEGKQVFFDPMDFEPSADD